MPKQCAGAETPNYGKIKTTLRIGDRKVRRQAEKALTALDRIKACANTDWRATDPIRPDWVLMLLLCGVHGG